MFSETDLRYLKMAKAVPLFTSLKVGDQVVFEARVHDAAYSYAFGIVRQRRDNKLVCDVVRTVQINRYGDVIASAADLMPVWADKLKRCWVETLPGKSGEWLLNYPQAPGMNFKYIGLYDENQPYSDRFTDDC